MAEYRVLPPRGSGDYGPGEPHTNFSSAHQSRVGYWWTVAFGAVLAILGLLIGAGGAWLLALGGSWYYLVAGTGLIVAGVLMIRRDMNSVWVYAATWLFTLVWAYWEAGTNVWALVPRLVAPSILLIFVLFTIPALSESLTYRALRRNYGALAFALLVGTGTVASSFGSITMAQAQMAQPQQPSSVQPKSSAGNTENTDTAQADKPDVADHTTIAATGVTVAATPLPQLAVGKDWPVYGGSTTRRAIRRSTRSRRDNVGELEEGLDLSHRRSAERGGRRQVLAREHADQGRRHLYLCSAKNIIIVPRRRRPARNLALRSESARRCHPLWRHLPRRRLSTQSRTPSLTTSVRDAHHRRHARRAPDCRRCETGQLCPDFGTQGHGRSERRASARQCRAGTPYVAADDRARHRRHRRPGARTARPRMRRPASSAATTPSPASSPGPGTWASRT